MNTRHLSSPVCRAIAITALLSGCASMKPQAGTQPKGKAASVDVGFLLSMTFEEAASMARQQLNVPNLPKVAADDIEVLRRTKDGKPQKVRAKGHVFVQIPGMGEARALCEEALLSEDEQILRGRPVLKRGSSTVEGLSAGTVFYLYGQRLRAIGSHRLTNPRQLARQSPWQRLSSDSLLPPLNPADVPEAMREEMRKAAEAEAALQRSRIGKPAAFPTAPER